MLFNSYLFLLGFLPLSLAGYRLIGRAEPARCWYLIAISLAFYGYWDWRFVPLLVGSVLVNWAAAWLAARWQSRAILIATIALNLVALAHYKYAGFFLGNFNAALGARFAVDRTLLPLGISFFTFNNIMYLADRLRKKAPIYRFRDYALYIVLFPQIVAGPLVRHWELIPQIRQSPWRDGTTERIGRGLTLLIIGLVKKTMIADSLAGFVSPLFEGAQHQVLSFAESLAAVLGFTFQIYFDFSGYSDMAIGVALMFGFVLPFNFDAPYRAVSLRDFWRRWHMTLSRFLRDYLYIPLGGSRHGLPRTVAALLGTMLLGGLWHGAGWTFVIWGGLHGIGLAAGTVWRKYLPPMPQSLSLPLTLLFVVLSWIFFRASSLHEAMNLFAGLGFAQGLGPFRHFGTILAAALIAILGPTSQDVALQKLKPSGWGAVAAALAVCLVLLKLGDDSNYEFIYFQF